MANFGQIAPLVFSEDFHADELFNFLEQDRSISREVLQVLLTNQIDGKTFKMLTKDKLDQMKIDEKEQAILLMRISEVNEAFDKDIEADFFNIDDLCCEDCLTLPKTSLIHQQSSNQVNIVMNTLLPVHLWGWDRRDCSLLVFFWCKRIRKLEKWTLAI
jgi:hypothetical protein